MRRRLSLAAAMVFSVALLLAPLVARPLGEPLVLRGALAALVSGASLGLFLARLLDRRAAAYGVAALTTMPLFFLAARARPADAVAMAACSAAFGGLAVAALDRRRGDREAVRLGSLTMGVAGLVAGGLSRGALLGVAVPALGVGLAWALLGLRRDALANACGALSLVAGTLAAVLSLARSATAATHPTFDVVLHHLGHSLFPWSGLLPLTWLALLSPPSRHGALAVARDQAARVVVLTGAAVSFGAHTLVGVDQAAPPFTAPVLLAAALAIAARDLDRRGAPSLRAGLRHPHAARLAALSAALLTALLARDLLDVPALQLGPLPRLLAKHALWALPLTLATLAALPLAARDALHALRRRTRISRGQAVVGTVALTAALLGWGRHPALGEPLHAPSPAAAPRTAGGDAHAP